MAISGHQRHHTTSHTNPHIGVMRFRREIICKRQNIINLVLFGNPIEIAIILISDNSGASGSSGPAASRPGCHVARRRWDGGARSHSCWLPRGAGGKCWRRFEWPESCCLSLGSAGFETIDDGKGSSQGGVGLGELRVGIGLIIGVDGEIAKRRRMGALLPGSY